MSIQTIRHRNSISMVLVLLGLLLVGSPGWSAILNPTITITNDVNGDGIAGLGDSLTFTCRATNASAGATPYVDLSVLGNSRFYLPNIVSNWYSAIYSLSSAHKVDNAAYGPYFWDDDGLSGPGNTISIDVWPPTSLLGIVLDPTAATGIGGVYKNGDHLKFTITFTDADAIALPPRVDVFADLTTLDLGNHVRLTSSGGGVFPYDQQIPTNRELNGAAFSILAIDDAGNRKTPASAISYDTRIPEFQSCTATNLSGTSYVKAGDQIKITAVIKNFDNETLEASHSVLIPGSPAAMTKVSTSGTTATFEYTFQVASGSNIDSSFVRFDVRAVDDAGNEFTRSTNALAFDTIPPGFQSANVFIIEKSGVIDVTTAIIGDTLHFYGNLDTPLDPGVGDTVMIDLSAIGGVSNQIMTFGPASTDFELYYDVHQYTSENNVPRAFIVTATDKANNKVYRYTLPVIYVDNLPPSISGGQLQKVTAGGGVAKLDDTIGIQANVTNPDGGSIWTDLGQVGGAASSTLTPYGGSTYRIEHIITQPTSGYTAIDTSKLYRIYATDDAGNLVYTDTNTLGIDNEPPVILIATYTVTPNFSSGHPWVKVNDTVKFLVSLASSSANPHDGETVTMNLSGIGGTTNQSLTYDGVGTFTFQMLVAAGSLNNDTYLTAVARDNAGNTDTEPVLVHIDNVAPTPGPMTVNFLTDMAKAGAVNLGDRLEFIIPVADPDFGTCTLDLSLVGSSSSSILNYDSVLSRYYLVYDTATATVENAGYVFRAVVTDKAGNSMNSLSGSFEVDCVPPIVNYASMTLINLLGSSTVANVGDKITITAKVDRVRMDGGTPVVNLTTIGGNGAQILYDDGAHDDGGATDGIFGFTQVVKTGTSDGLPVAFIVELTDNAGNRVAATTEAVYVDNQPLIITSFVAAQTFDNNGNTVVDLDGYYTTYPIVATDVTRMTVNITGNTTDFGSLTIDLLPLGINDSARIMPVTTVPGGWTSVASYSPFAGTTNRENITFRVTLTDVNGNTTIATSAQSLLVDNQPPTLQVYPISFVVDQGRLNEANEMDVIRLKVRLQNHDGILPQLDLTNLYFDNGLPPPSPILFPPGGPNEYSYDWTVPPGLGTLASLTILAYDQSGNMVVGYTNVIRFLSKKPSIMGFPDTRCDLASDVVPLNLPNRIANPGDQVKITCVLNSAYNATNNPPATVLADVRSIVNSSNDDEFSQYNDGNFSTFWSLLTYQSPIASGGPFVYSRVYTVQKSNTDTTLASFSVKVVHPDTTAITMASSTIQCDPANPFGIDSQVPYISQGGFHLFNDHGDNVSSGAMNIGDTMRVWATIKDFPDPGSASVILEYPTAPYAGFYKARLEQIPDTEDWQAFFDIATGGVSEWPILDELTPRVEIMVSDDADNMGPVFVLPPGTFTIDTDPPIIKSAQLLVSNPQNLENWLANIGDGFPSSRGDQKDNDSIIASVTVATISDLILPKKGRAWVDFSTLQGSTTWALSTLFAPRTLYSNPFALATQTFEFATRTFNIYVRDQSGNRAVVPVEIAVDTTRPYLQTVTYDGSLLGMRFSEILKLFPVKSLDTTRIRIGTTQDLRDPLLVSRATQLTALDGIITTDDSRDIQIQMSPGTKAIIADWGSAPLYIGMGFWTNDGEAPLGSSQSIGLDLSGNWLRPLPWFLASTPITITNPYTTRPILINGYYRADNPTDENFFFIDFDKDMDPLTITTDTLKALAIWRSRGNPDDTYANRYRFYNDVASDTPSMGTFSKRIQIQLSRAAKDWIAISYGRTASAMALQVDDNTPPLIRDFSGNRVVPIPYFQATAATLIPLTSGFSIQGTHLDLGGPKPILTLDFQGLPNERRARLYTDPYKALKDRIELSRDLPVDLSRVYLYQNAEGTSGFFPLNSAMVDFAEFKVLNADYASLSVHIPLQQAALNILLSWGTTKFYIACEAGAFKDLWGNDTLRKPVQGTVAEVITDLKLPPAFGAAKILTLAMGPLIDPLNHPSLPGKHLLKGFNSGLFTYEVTFDTATISGNVYLPIDRSLEPTLEFFTQATPNESIDVPASFTGWFDHKMGGITRTGARFVNRNDFSADSLKQRVPTFVRVKNFRHIFWDQSVPPPDDEASLTYNLVDKNESAMGFLNASLTACLDNQRPHVATITPTGIIPITPVSEIFLVTFDEPMDQTAGVYPTLALLQGSSVIMGFTFVSWVDAYTAKFRNNVPFNETTTQGIAQYQITAGRDEATNPHDQEILGQVDIRSKGPVINSINILTVQRTVEPSTILTNQPFSPFVPPFFATISVSLTGGGTAVPSEVRFYDGAIEVGSLPMALGTSGEYVASWDGQLALRPPPPFAAITTAYELQIYDSQGNEGSRRGSVVYDGVPPSVQYWTIGNISTYNGKAYFSPAVKGFAKIDIFGPSAGETLRLALANTTAPLATAAYYLSPLSGSGYTISWDGKKPAPDNAMMPDDEYAMWVVDAAGNVGIPAFGGNASMSIVVDSKKPQDIAIQTIALGVPVSRFNPNVASLTIQVATTDTSLGSGTALARIMSGASVIRDVPLFGALPALAGTWDGKDSKGILVPDGSYRIYVIDLAENQSDAYKDIDVVTSIFKLSAVTQLDRTSVRVTFTHPLNVSSGEAPGNYSLTSSLSPTPLNPNSATVSDKDVTLVFDPFTHNIVYTITAAAGLLSIDGATIATGYDKGEFTADTQGPQVTNVTFENITSQKEFNLTFDEQIAASSATSIGNYTLQTSTGTISIASIVLRSDNKSVKITALEDLREAMNYTIIASGVEDLYKNPSDGSISRKTFAGQDVTPPTLKVSVFSNPANEFDITIAVLSNENLSGAPTAAITQSGGTATTITLNSGPTSLLYLGGAHLDKSHPGVATIKVTGKDVAGNSTTNTVSFSTAYVNASLRAEIKSSDLKFAVVFEAGALTKDSMISLFPVPIATGSSAGSSSNSTGIAGITGITGITGMRIDPLLKLDAGKAQAIRLAAGDGLNEELVPLGDGYFLGIPSGRLNGQVNLLAQLPASGLPTGGGMFQMQSDGTWKLLATHLDAGNIVCKTSGGGTFALLKDTKAPRASLLTQIDLTKPLRQDRPTFEWKLTELGSGIAPDGVKVLLNGEECDGLLEPEIGRFIFIPASPLPEGDYDLSLRSRDNAGNMAVTPAIRFQVIPKLVIHEIVQFPNPASSRVSLRVSANRKLTSDLLEVSVYDSAGQKVIATENMAVLSRTEGTHKVQDIVWDLRNSMGNSVANGVYFAKITVHDPDNYDQKVKVTHKIAVLR